MLEGLREYAETEAEKRTLEARIATGSNRKAAKKLGISRQSVDGTIKRIKKRAASKGYSPDHDMVHTVPDGYKIKGTSTLYDEKGQPKLQWVKSQVDHERQLELIKELAASLCDDIKPHKPVPAPKHHNDDLMCIVPIGDAHIGMLSWAEETGADYDLKIAESVHKRAIDQLIQAAPDADHCVILDVGDFIHADNLMGVTSRSGHNLDMDGRYHKVVRVCMNIVSYYIDQALTKFQNVIYRPEIGNHNDVGAIWLQEAFARVYSNEPRVTIANNAGNRFFFQHGLCYFGCHHGHEIKMDRLPDVMATHIMDLGIQTKYRKWFTGHIHHESKKDYNSCSVQSYRTLASLDAYASSHGYNAPRDISMEVWHKEHGEVATHRVNIEMLEGGQ